MANNAEYEYLLKLVLIGNPKVEKSALLLRYVDDIWDDNIVPPNGRAELKNKIIQINGKGVKMQIWDTTGSIKYVTETNLKSTDGVLLIYNITDRESFENLNSWLTEVKKNAEKGTCILLVGVNSDLEDERKVSYQEGKDFATSNGIKFFEVSAKNNINVKEAFEILSEDILNTKVNLKKYDDMNKPFHPVLPRKKDGFCNIY